jgi:ferric-dicitrate binding protein FerR (iron transport regulator)
VAKMANKPLVVSTGDVDVRVLGTHFIVSAYPDQNLTKTTLLEGSVKVLHGDDSAMLQPGQQARVDKNGKIAIHDDVNLMLESSWIHGIFLFDHFTVPEIMAQISRWYDIEVEYDGDITNKTFSGIVSRKSNISKVLKIMERAGLQFTVDDKKIIVSQ